MKDREKGRESSDYGDGGSGGWKEREREGMNLVAVFGGVGRVRECWLWWLLGLLVVMRLMVMKKTEE